MYIIDIISCTNWLFALLGSYKKLPCAVQVVFRKELGRIQPLGGGRRCFQTPFNHWISGVTPNIGQPMYPLVNIQKAIENDHRNSGFSH